MRLTKPLFLSNGVKSTFAIELKVEKSFNEYH
jgi:hypothetical protein